MLGAGGAELVDHVVAPRRRQRDERGEECGVQRDRLREAVRMASLEFGALVLGARAVVVLGHTRCGAVEAALAAKPVPGQISTLYQHIAPGLDPKGDVANAVEANVRAQLKKLNASPTVIAELVRSGRIVTVGAVYDLATGKVRTLS